MNNSESFQASLKSMKEQNIDFNTLNLSNKSATNILQKHILNKKLSNIRYFYGSLVLEFGILDENDKWEYSIVCECDRKIQQDYEVLCHGNMEKEIISKSILLYKDKLLVDIFVIESTWELYLNFWDVYLTTLSTYRDHIGRQFWFNRVWNWYRKYISSDKMGMYIYDMMKKPTEI